MHTSAPDPVPTGGSGVAPTTARPGFDPDLPSVRRTGTRRARLLRRLRTQAMGVSQDAETVLRWLAEQVTKAPTPKERRLCAEAFLRHLRELAKGDAEAAAAAGARVLVVSPDDLRRLLASAGGPGEVVAALEGLATPPAPGAAT